MADVYGNSVTKKHDGLTVTWRVGFSWYVAWESATQYCVVVSNTWYQRIDGNSSSAGQVGNYSYTYLALTGQTTYENGATSWKLTSGSAVHTKWQGMTYVWNKANYDQGIYITMYGQFASPSAWSGSSTAQTYFVIPALQPSTIAFNKNETSTRPVSGDLPSSINTYVGVGNTIPSVTLTRQGFTFNGWNTNAGGTGTAVANGGSYTPSSTGTTTLYAQWVSTYSAPTINTKRAYRVDHTATLSGSSPNVLPSGERGYIEFVTSAGTGVTSKTAIATVKLNDTTIETITMSSEQVTGTTDTRFFCYTTQKSVDATKALSLVGLYTIEITMTVNGDDGVVRTIPTSTYIAKEFRALDVNRDCTAIAMCGVAPDDESGFYIGEAKYGMVGEIKMYAGATAPKGWLICDGSAVSRTTYSGLFEVIGTTYGSGDGSTTFNLPNFDGRMPVGKSATDGDFDLGDRGGAKGAWQHGHSTSASFTVGYAGGSGTSGIPAGVSGWGGYPNAHWFGVNVNGSANNTLSADKANMPPYQTINFIICYQ